MAIFNINVNDQSSFIVNKILEIATDCSTIYEYEVIAENGDNVNISLLGDHISESYTLNGIASAFTDSTTVVFNNSLIVRFVLSNSGVTGYFNNATLSIENTTTASSVDTFTFSLERQNDSSDCNQGEVGIDSHISNVTVVGNTLNFTGIQNAFNGSVDLSALAIPTVEINDLTDTVIWANVPDINITESSVVQHQAALTIQESQIVGLNYFSGDYNDLINQPVIPVNTNDYVDSISFNSLDGNLTLGRTGVLPDLVQNLDGRYLQSFTESDPIFTGSPAFSITNPDISNWNTAYNNHIVQIDITGTTTKTVTLTQQDGGILTANFLDLSGSGGDGNDFLNNGSFNNTTGDLTLNVTNQPDVIINLDGRYSTSDTNDIDYINSSSFVGGTLTLSGIGNAGTSINLDGRYSLVTPTGLEAIDEGNGIGWRLIGKDPGDFANIGKGAIDFGASSVPNNTNGASGAYSFNVGEDNIASGYGAITMGAFLTNTGQLSTLFGQLVDNNTYGTFLTGYNISATGGLNRGYNLSSGRGNRLIGGFGNTLLGTSLTQTDGVGVVVLGHGNEAITTLNNTTEKENPILIIGNGTHTTAALGDWTAATRSNALVLRNSGRLTLNAYGNNEFVSTPTYNLAVDIDGNVIETELIDADVFVPYIGATGPVDLGNNLLGTQDSLILTKSGTLSNNSQGLHLYASNIVNGTYDIFLNANNEANAGLNFKPRGVFNFTTSIWGSSTLKAIEVAGTTARVKFNQYGLNNITGTPTYNLAVDASGNIIETALISAPISPTGLEAINEGNGIGWRLIGKDPTRFGNIGFDAVDLSESNTLNNSTNGATGTRSLAYGQEVEASGDYSFAGGVIVRARGSSSIALGSNFEALANGSGGIAHNSVLNGIYSFAANRNNSSLANAAYGAVFGNNNTSHSLGEFVAGLYSTEYVGGSLTFVGTDRIFNIGNGTSVKRADAFTILKNGQTSIGIDNFEANSTGERLQVSGTTKTNLLKIEPQTFTGLPASPTAGLRAIVTDSTTNVFNAVTTGGGAITIPVFFDGTDWRVG